MSAVDRNRIQNALAHVHHWEQHGMSRPAAASEAMLVHQLLSEETGILLRALHVTLEEVAAADTIKRQP